MKKILSLYLFSLFAAVVFAQDGVVADDAAAQKGDAAKVAKKEKKKRDAKIIDLLIANGLSDNSLDYFGKKPSDYK